jgi:hypothetical protein
LDSETFCNHFVRVLGLHESISADAPATDPHPIGALKFCSAIDVAPDSCIANRNPDMSRSLIDGRLYSEKADQAQKIRDCVRAATNVRSVISHGKTAQKFLQNSRLRFGAEPTAVSLRHFLGNDTVISIQSSQ